MGRRVLFLYNPHAGTGLVRSALSDILDIFAGAGYEITVRPTQSRGDATEVVRTHAAEYDRIVCAGGDGTLDEVVSGVLESGVDVEVGYIPAGSTNDYGNSLGIDKDLRYAAQIAAGGRPFSVDIGSFNDRYFIYVAAFGLFTEVSYQTPQEMKNVFGHGAYIMEAVKQLADIPSVKLQVECNGEVIYGEFIYGMITNATSVGGISGIIPGDISLHDEKFEVTLVRTPANPLELTEIVSFFTGTYRDTDLVYTAQTSDIKITSKEPLSWTLDGEYGGEHEVARIGVLPGALTIMVE